MKIFNVLIIIFLITINMAIAGELEPPGLPNQGTMKTLQQVAPRGALVPPPGQTLFIDQPGSYYLTGEYNPPADIDAIQIGASNVTLDLNGFSLIGFGGGNTKGVYVAAGKKNVVIKNGIISSFDRGVYTESGTDVTISDMIIQSNVRQGVYASGSVVITNSIITENGVQGNSSGVFFLDQNNLIFSRVEDSIVTNNFGSGVTLNNNATNGGIISGSVVLNNGTNDINLSRGLVVNSVYQDAAIGGDAQAIDSLDLP